MKPNRIFPSLISSDLLNLNETITMLEPHCAGFHLDVMDFHFVPNLTWGPDFINAIRKASKKQLWIDLLVDLPQPYLERLRLHENDIISIHYESDYDNDIFHMIRKKGWKASLALAPEAPVEVIMPFLDVIDHVLIMSAPLGFSGQEFVYDCVEKVKKLYALRKELAQSPEQYQFSIGMDGGLNETTLPLVAQYADTFAIATGIFGAKNQIEQLQKLEGIQ